MGPVLRVPVGFESEAHNLLRLALDSGVASEAAWALNALGAATGDAQRGHKLVFGKACPGLLDSIARSLARDLRATIRDDDRLQASALASTRISTPAHAPLSKKRAREPNDALEPASSAGWWWDTEPGLFEEPEDSDAARKRLCAAATVLRNAVAGTPANRTAIASNQLVVATLADCLNVLAAAADLPGRERVPLALPAAVLEAGQCALEVVITCFEAIASYSLNGSWRHL